MGEVARLTDLEIMVMRVLWEHDEAMTIQEIAGCLEEERVSTQSVKQCIRHLLFKKAVTVCESVLVATVYARTFKACFTQEEFLAAEYTRLQKCVFGKRKRNTAGIAVAMLCDNDGETVSEEDIKRLQAYIDAKTEQMKRR